MSETELITVGWQSVEDCLPSTMRTVLATDGGSFYVAYFDGAEWFQEFDDEKIDYYVSHWQEFPALPGEEE